VIEDSCLPVLPHFLCEYLYDLSKNFNRFCDESSVCEVGSVLEDAELLLCEATRVVMEKGFQLLGITPESSSLGEGWPPSIVIISASNRKIEPQDSPKINTRFELFSFYPHITRDCTFRAGKMFGQILISDAYNRLSDGLGPTNVADHGFVSLFDCYWLDSVDITKHQDGEDDARRCLWTSKGADGLVRIYYVLLKDAIDSTIKVTYLPNEDGVGEVYGEIFAHYGSGFFIENMDPVEKDYYTATLF
nr:arginine--tRNA ligase, chloroplastic/mitochondrial [Tanacetum cinerariifolium]